MFGYKAKAIPYVDLGYDLDSIDGDGNSYRVEYSPFLEKGPVDFTITTKYTSSRDWQLIITFNEGWDGYLQIDYKTRLGKYLIRNVLDDNDEPVKFSKDQMLAKVKEISGIDLTDVGPSHYDRDLMKEEDEDDDDSNYLEKLFDLVSSGEVEQAFDLADSLGMEKELIERIVNDKNNDDLNGLTFAISDKGTVAIVHYAATS